MEVTGEIMDLLPFSWMREVKICGKVPTTSFLKLHSLNFSELGFHCPILIIYKLIITWTFPLISAIALVILIFLVGDEIFDIKMNNPGRYFFIQETYYFASKKNGKHDGSSDLSEFIKKPVHICEKCLDYYRLKL